MITTSPRISTVSHIARKIQFERTHPRANVHLVYDEFRNLGLLYEHAHGYCDIIIPAPQHSLQSSVDNCDPIVLTLHGAPVRYITDEAEYHNRKLVRSITYPKQNIQAAEHWKPRQHKQFRATRPNEYAAMKAYSYTQVPSDNTVTADFYSHSKREQDAIKYALPNDTYENLFHTNQPRSRYLVAKMSKYYTPTHTHTRLSTRPLRSCYISNLKATL